MNICILGFGSIGKRHHKILRDIFPDSKIDIYDPLLGFKELPSKKYDLGLICTTTNQHIVNLEQIHDKCDLIFIEKPLHSSFEEIKINQSRFSNNKIHVGCNVRYTKAIQRLEEIKDASKLIRVTAMSNLLKWRNDPERKAYSFHRNLGGGALVDFIHEPDYIRHVFGNPISTFVSQKRLFEGVTVDSDDSCVMIWDYQDRLVTFNISYSSIEYVRKIEILKLDMSEETIHITKDDIEESYRRQWFDIINNGPKNSYNDCVELYQKILEQT